MYLFPAQCCVCVVSMVTVGHHGDTRGAIHLYTGCVRGIAAGTSAPTTKPKCKCYGNTLRRTIQVSPTQIRPSPPLNWPTLFQQKGFFFLLRSVFFFINFLLVSLASNVLCVLLADIGITSCSAARRSDAFTQSSSRCSRSCEMMRIKNRASFNYTHI